MVEVEYGVYIKREGDEVILRTRTWGGVREEGWTKTKNGYMYEVGLW